jgi:hypothetical protein
MFWDEPAKAIKFRCPTTIFPSFFANDIAPIRRLAYFSLTGTL